MGLLSSVTDGLGLTDTEGAQGAIAGATAAQMQAMQGASDLIGRTTEQALMAGEAGSQAGMRRLMSGRGGIMNPLRQNAQSATPQGFAGNINELMTSGVLNPLIEQRQNDLGGRLGALGLSRSSGGMEQFLDVGTNTLFDIEGMLSGRQMGANTALSNANLGMTNAQIGLAMQPFQQRADLTQQRGINQANILTNQGAVQGQGLMASQQAAQAPGQFFQELIQGGAQAASAALAGG